MTRRNVACVGIHSLFMDGRMGTEHEKHAIFCDLDSKTLLTQHRDFWLDLQRPMQRFGVTDFYLFETQKGCHGFSPTLLSRKDTERFEEALQLWGGDGIHRTMSYRNGGAVLRISPKVNEGDPCQNSQMALGHPHCNPDCIWCEGTGWTGPRFIRHFQVPLKLAQDLPEWSEAHFTFFNDLHHNRLPRPAFFIKANPNATTVRLEHYETTEQAPHD